MSLEEKYTIISNIYYNEAGYGSIQTTYSDARLKNPKITLKYVKEWFAKNVGVKAQPGGTNSFIAPHAHYEYQMDLFRIKDLKEQKFTWGCVCVDVFSKYAAVVPMLDNKGVAAAAAIMECFTLVKKKPELLYTDGETSFDTYALREYYEKEKIKHYITRKHAAFAERFIRTFKLALYKRIDEGKVKTENPQWHDYIFEIMLTYNNKLKHSSTGKTPEDARKDTHQADVKANLEIRALKNRKYPMINVGDEVKIMRKKKIDAKDRTSNWSIEVYKVASISESLGQKYYKVAGTDYRDYTRAEILKVSPRKSIYYRWGGGRRAEVLGVNMWRVVAGLASNDDWCSSVVGLPASDDDRHSFDDLLYDKPARGDLLF